MTIQPMSFEVADAPARDASAQLLAQYRAGAAALPGAESKALRELRDRAIAAFAARGIPGRRVEEWKYTDLRSLMTQAFPVSGPPARIGGEALRAALGPLDAVEGPRLVFVNGRLDPALSSIESLPAGAELVTLAEALRRPADGLLDALGDVKGAGGDVVAQLNTAFASDGVVLRLAAGLHVETPIHLVHVAATQSPALSALRNLVILGEGAEATLIESYVCDGLAGAQINAVTQLVLEDKARLAHYVMAAENTETQHLASTLARLGAGADYQAVQMAVGGALSRLQTFVTFEGERAKAHFGGVQLMRGRQHCDMTLVIDHAAVGCESREHVKSVLDEQSRGVFQAKVIVRPGAQQTDGRQMAQALLLSDSAEFDAKPELEIYADDVKCNHGATSGAIDEDLLFYLRSRGIPADEARALLVQAFIGEILDRISHEGLRQALEAKAALWLTPRG
jgi:Fe-S cluster assembly protein SufD